MAATMSGFGVFILLLAMNPNQVAACLELGGRMAWVNS
jgi:hypothetical protein